MVVLTLIVLISEIIEPGEIRQILSHALKYYEEKLQNLIDNNKTFIKDDPRLYNEIAYRDIENLLQRIKGQFSKAQSSHSIEDYIKINENIISCALTVYIKGLESTKQAISEHLGGAELDLENTNKEIQLSKQIIQKYTNIKPK